MAVDLGTAFGRIVLDTSGAGRSIGSLRSQMGVFARSALPMVAGITAVAGAFTHVVSTASNFSSAMSGVAAVSNATAGEMDALREQALALGKSTAFSASEVAAAQGELVKAGVSVQEVLGGALPGALSLAAAGDLDLAKAATIAANAMNLFGLRGQDVTHIADALATAANSTTADVGDMGIALSQGGSAARAAGLSFEETVTYLEALAAAGIKNSDAGTSLKAALTQLLSPTKQAAAAMKEHGLVLTDAQGNFVGAEEASRRLTRATQDMNAAERVAFLTTIAGVDGFRTLLSLIDTGPGRLARYRAGLDRAGSAAETAAKRQDNLRGDVEQLSGAIETAEIRLGSMAEGPLRAATQAVTGLITAASQPGALSGLVDQLDLDTAAASAWAGLTSTISALAPVAEGAAVAVGGTVRFLSGAADAAGSMFTALSPLVGATATLAGGALQAAGALNALTGGLLSSAPGTAVLTAAVVALTGALVANRVAALATAISLRAVAAGQTIAAFVSLAAQVRSVSGALTLMRTAAVGGGGVAGVFSKLLSPAGLAGAAIGLVTAGVAALASGMFRTRSPVLDVAGALKEVENAARAASGAVQTMNDVTDKLADANLRTARAALGVERAEAQYEQAVRSAGRGSLEAREAAVRLREARTELTRATRDESRAQTGAAASAATLFTRLSVLATAQGTAAQRADLTQRVMSRFGSVIDEQAPAAQRAARQLAAITEAGATTAQRMAALQRAALAAAREIKGTGPAAQAARAQLATLASLDAGGLQTFVADVQKGMDEGKTRAQATKDAIAKALRESDTSVDMSAFVASVEAGGEAARRAIARKVSEIRAEMNKADPRRRGSPAPVELVRDGMRELARAVAAGGTQVTAAARSFRQQARGGFLGTAQDIASARAAIELQLSAIDTAEQNYQRRRDARQRIAQAQAALRRADTADERKEAQRDVAQARADMRELQRLLRQEAADRTRIARLRRGPEARAALLDQIESIREAASTAGADLADRVTRALDRSFQARMEAIDDRLALTMSSIDAGMDRTTEAIAAGVAVSLGDLADLPGEVRAAFENVAGVLATALAPVDAAIASTRAGVDAIESELDRRRRARQDRQQAAALREAESTKAAVDAEVERLQVIQASARTDSERAAAARLLGDALTRQAAAGLAVSDAQEDISTTGLERTRDTWQGAIDQAEEARDKLVAAATETATTIAENARTAATTGAEAARDELDAKLAEVRTALERDLGTLGEALNANNTRLARRAIAGIQDTLADPAVRSALDDSGRELGIAFSRGLDRSTAVVTGSAKKLAAVVARYLKLDSPAEAGPLRHDFAESGRTIGADLAAGMSRSLALVQREAARLGAAAFVGAGGAAAGAPAAGGATVNQQNTFVVQRPVEDLRTWAERASFEARLAGGRV